jgi:hypothetical protein
MVSYEMLDAFGTRFTFNAFTKPFFKSVYGAFLTIFTFIMVMIFSLILGSDFYFRQNPHVTNQGWIDPNKPWARLTNLSFFAWKISLENVEANILTTVYPNLYYISQFKGQDFKFLTLNFINCTKSDNPVMRSYADFFCIDTSNSNIQNLILGSEDKDNYGMLSLGFNICNDSIPYNKSEPSCSSKKSLKPISFTFLTQDVTFNPESFEKPIALSLSNYDFQLDINLQKKDTITFREVYIQDDRGWMLKSINSTSFLSFDSFSTEYSYVSDEDLFGLGTQLPSNFYVLQVKISRKFISYNRSYMKLQDVGAILGGILSFFVMIFRNLCYYINLHLMKEFYFNHLFNFENPTSEKGTTRIRAE